MKSLLVPAFCVVLAGCAGMNERIDASRQDRCQRADWSQVGERDGIEGAAGMAERYGRICGDMFQAAPYKEGFDKGFARRPRPTV